MLLGQHHSVIVDVPRIAAAPYRWVLDNADFRVIVADQTLQSVRDATRLRAALAEDVDHRNLLVINRAGEAGRRAVPLKEMESVLELRPNFVIPYEPASFAKAINAGQPAGGSGAAVSRTGSRRWRPRCPGARRSGAAGGGGDEKHLRAPGRRARRVTSSSSFQGMAATGRLPGSTVRSDIKERIWNLLMSRIDPAAAARLPRTTLTSRDRQARSARSRPRSGSSSTRAKRTRSRPNSPTTWSGSGPLEPFLDDDEVTDILVNGPYDVFMSSGAASSKRPTPGSATSQHVVNVAQRIAAAVGRRIDEASPMVDARLADGSRVNIVLPPLVLNGGTISIRKFPKQSITLDMMVRQRQPVAERWRGFLRDRRADARQHPDLGRHRLGQDDAAERGLALHRPRRAHHHDRGRRRAAAAAAACRADGNARRRTSKASAQIPQRELVRNALRMRPDRIIVGEVRGPEAFDMLQAMNTGHDGSMSTIHANTPRDALVPPRKHGA